MQFEAQLVHAEDGKRVVQVRAMDNDHCLGSALGEGSTAEEAEDRASKRLLARLEESPKPNPKEINQPKAQPVPRAESPAQNSVRINSTAPSTSQALSPSAATDSEPKLPPFPKPEAPSDENGGEPEDWSSELARLDLQLQRLGWSREEEAIFLERAFGHPSRNRLTSYVDLVAYLKTVEALEQGANPGNAPVPLRRKDLLNQCDQLLEQLHWDAARGRAFLDDHFNLSSRQQLNDSQLLQFNMLLEGELIGA